MAWSLDRLDLTTNWAEMPGPDIQVSVAASSIPEIWSSATLRSFRTRQSAVRAERPTPSASAHRVAAEAAVANEFVARASGGIAFFTSGNLFTGVKVDPGGNAWSATSDRNAKENLKAVDVRAVLDKVSRMPVTEWNLKTQDPAIRHLGPMAQDFHATFGLGSDDRHISTTDADGVRWRQFRD